MTVGKWSFHPNCLNYNEDLLDLIAEPVLKTAMGGIASKDVSKLFEDGNSTLCETVSIRTLSEGFDPRSPTVGIDRTPIQVAATRPVVDPRSPTLGIERTPIHQGYFNDDEIKNVESGECSEMDCSRDCSEMEIKPLDLDQFIPLEKDNVTSLETSTLLPLETTDNCILLETDNSDIASPSIPLAEPQDAIENKIDAATDLPEGVSKENIVLTATGKNKRDKRANHLSKLDGISRMTSVSKPVSPRSPLSTKNIDTNRPLSIVQRKQSLMVEKLKNDCGPGSFDNAKLSKNSYSLMCNKENFCHTSGMGLKEY